MKAFCIDNYHSNLSDINKPCLTIGKIYNISDYENSLYLVMCIDDYGRFSSWDRGRFKLIEDFREEKLNDILNDEY